MPIMLAIAILLSLLPAPGRAQESTSGGPSVALTQWLVLGPAAHPLPVFHGEKPGGYGLEELLKAEPFPKDQAWPEEGSAAGWFAGDALGWTRRGAGGDGTVAIERPGGTKAPAAAFLAAYVTADRFQALDLEVKGTHPRRAWLDGEPAALGGVSTSGAGAEAKGRVKLTTGKHLLVIWTVLDPERDAVWAAGAELRGPKDQAAITGIVVGTSPQRDVDLLDAIDAPRVTSADVSPDGALVAATISRIVPGTDDAESWLEVRSTRDGALRRTWRGGSALSQVAWAPTGSRLTYVTAEKNAKGEDAGSTLWIADLDSGSVEPIVERVEDFASYQWSPAGTLIAYSVSVKPEPDKRGLKRHENLLDRQADYRTRRHVRLVTWPGRAERRLTAGSLTASVAAFSPDGHRLILVRNVEDLSERPYSRQEAWEVDLASFEAKKLGDLRWVNDIAWAPDGTRLLVQGGPSAFGKVGWNVPDGLLPNENEGEAYIWEPGSGTIAPITHEFDPSVSSVHWSRKGGRIYLRATDRDRASLFGYDPATRRFWKIETGFDVVAWFDRWLKGQPAWWEDLYPGPK